MKTSLLLNAMESLEKRRVPYFLISVAGIKGSSPREIGAKMIVSADGIEGTIGGGNLEFEAIAEAKQNLLSANHQSYSKNFSLSNDLGQCCGGSVDLLFDSFQPAPRCLIFGAGHVGSQLAKTLGGSPYELHLLDNRKEYLEGKFTNEIDLHYGDFDDFMATDLFTSLDQHDRAVVMTHDHGLDQEIVEGLLGTRLQFVGLIGSEAKWSKFSRRLLAKGFAQEDLSRVYCPIGLNLGGKTPFDVAISITSQLVFFYHHGLREEIQDEKIPCYSFGGRQVPKDGNSKMPSPL